MICELLHTIQRLFIIIIINLISALRTTVCTHTHTLILLNHYKYTRQKKNTSITIWLLSFLLTELPATSDAAKNVLVPCLRLISQCYQNSSRNQELNQQSHVNFKLHQNLGKLLMETTCKKDTPSQALIHHEPHSVCLPQQGTAPLSYGHIAQSNSDFLLHWS